MLSNEEIKQKLQAIDGVHLVDVDGDGYHYKLTVVSNIFTGKSKVARSQWVYQHLGDFIKSGALHALTMQTMTIDEWEQQHG